MSQNHIIFTQPYEKRDYSLSMFVQTGELQGRGQAGLAGFYQQEGSGDKEYLIKQDDPATCLLEGSACFAALVLPDTQVLNTRDLKTT